MPKFSDSDAAKVDISLPSNPIVSATTLVENGAVIQLYDKRLAKTEFGESMFVDFMYADDPYNEEGYRDNHYTTVFTANSPAYRQLLAVDNLNYNDPLEVAIAPAGRSFKLIDPDAPIDPPTSPQASKAAPPAQAPSRPGANAATRTNAPTTRPAQRAAAPRGASPKSTIPDDLPF